MVNGRAHNHNICLHIPLGFPEKKNYLVKGCVCVCATENERQTDRVK